MRVHVEADLICDEEKTDTPCSVCCVEAMAQESFRYDATEGALPGDFRCGWGGLTSAVDSESPHGVFQHKVSDG